MLLHLLTCLQTDGNAICELPCICLLFTDTFLKLFNSRIQTYLCSLTIPVNPMKVVLKSMIECDHKCQSVNKCHLFVNHNIEL